MSKPEGRIARNAGYVLGGVFLALLAVIVFGGLVWVAQGIWGAIL